MKRNISFAVLFALLAAFAYAANSNPAPMHTFLCYGDAKVGPCPNGGGPNSLIQGSDGNFYGTAQITMEGSAASLGGTVFSLTPAGVLTVLHKFVPGPNQDYANGNLPGSLIEGPDGRLYGYTTFGGVNGCNGYCGYGVLFRINRDGSVFTILQEFCADGGCGDLRPTSTPMVAGTDGNLYGTIYGNGSPYGSIFRITPSTGAYEIVLTFNFSTGEGFPSALTVAPDGSFYALALSSLPALLLHYTPTTGDLTTAVVNFPFIDSFLPSSPASTLILGPNGNLYGLFRVYAINGTGLFELQPDGSNLQLFPLYNTIPGGGSPDGLILASDGNFWVADFAGGAGDGDIVSLSPVDGALLRRFAPFSKTASVGAYPEDLVQAKDGTLWGSAESYGNATTGHFASGTVFRLNAGLPPR
jgi:uncharacterized repeat protein (TIGR03803 family)